MILVTGGRGFIGTHTTRALRGLGEDCLPIGRGDADCTDLDALRALGAKYSMTGIVHLAAIHLGGAPAAEELRANLTATLNIATVAAEWGVGRVVSASTIGVYGGVPGPVWREDAPLPPRAAFAIPASKKASEIVVPLAAGDAVEVVHARIGSIWGPLGRPSSPFMAVPALVHAAVRGTEPPDAYAEDAIDIGYVRDCGRALALLATAPRLRHAVYNVSGGAAVSNARFVDALRNAVPDAVLPLHPGPRPAAARLDLTRLTDDTGYRPAFDLDAAVADYVGWLRAGNTR
ncbi:NAD-dependent epimerase/dehydratase family protein [Cryptosporangium sp. NPDC048952]|uniref:NAD-dependent epimerase/dehydratase family protein n=1 Tax=Cryptosporangium sp. NPDC048952 TaxID=3363961 RepID=UPI00371B32C5